MNTLPKYHPKGSNVLPLGSKTDAELSLLIKQTAINFGFPNPHDYVRTILNAHGKGLIQIDAEKTPQFYEELQKDYDKTKKRADDLTEENQKQDSLIQGLRIQLKNTQLILESKDTTGIPKETLKDTSETPLEESVSESFRVYVRRLEADNALSDDAFRNLHKSYQEAIISGDKVGIHQKCEATDFCRSQLKNRKYILIELKWLS
jgi:hypothetical protein